MREQERAGQGGSTPGRQLPRQDAAPEGGGGEGGGGGGGGGSRQVDAPSQEPCGHVVKAQDVLAQAVASAGVGEEEEEEEVRKEMHAHGAPGDGNAHGVLMRAGVGDCRESDGERDGERDREREHVLGVGGEESHELQGLDDSDPFHDTGQDSFQDSIDNSGLWESLDTIS